MMELIEKMKNKEIPTKSKFNLRNEKKQTFIRGNKFPRLKKTKKKISKLLFLKELAIPFDPWLCEITEEYNELSKFRTELSFSTMAKTLKTFYNQNPELKEKFMKLVKAKEWDTSDEEVLTEKDLEVLRSIRPTRIVSPLAIGINCQTVTNSPYQSFYDAGFDRDIESGDIIMPEGSTRETPEILEISRAFFSIFSEEYAAWEKANITESDEKKSTMRRDILGKNPVSGDRPLRIGVAIELEVDNRMRPKDALADLTAEDIKSKLVYVDITQKVAGAFEELSDKEKFLYKDTNLDFLEIDMVVGNEENDALRGQNTKFQTAADFKLSEDPGYDHFIEEVGKMIDEYGDMEMPLKKSKIYKKVDETLIQRLYQSLGSAVKFNTIEPFLTKEILKSHSSVLSDIYGDPIDNALMEVEFGAGKETLITEEQKKLINADLEEMSKPLNDEEIESVDLGL